MNQNQTPTNNIQQAIILDLSLFILDLLDSRKIKERTEIRDHILEVPSALVLMLRDSRVGDPTLFLFIYSLLVKTINKYKEKQITDRRIARLIDSPDFAVRGEAWRITQQLFDEFSSLIDIAPRETLSEDLRNQESEYSGEKIDYPIRRYDAIGSFSQEDQKYLQGIYTAELNLPVHPLYDLYFSQIYHAQTVGLTQESRILRRTVALDDETFNIVSEWKGKTKLEEKSNVVQASREFLKWFIFTYIKDEWQGVALDAGLELSVAGVLTGSLAGVGVSLVTLAGGTILKAVVVAPPHVLPDEYKIIFFVVILLTTIACVIILFKPTWFIPKLQVNPSDISLATLTSTPLLPDSTPTFISIPTMTLVIPTVTSVSATPIPPSATSLSNSPNYCLYVVQPGDTLQSIAAWFFVSENDIRNNDRLVSWGAFSAHQIINVPAACCVHINNNGFTYSVQPQDNVFRLAINFSTSAEKIAAANNLFDLRYIQAGQNLCIPYP